MKYEQVIKKDLKLKRKKLTKKKLKETILIICIITAFLCIIALCGGFDTANFLDRLINCVGILIIMSIIGILLYAYKIFPYRKINPNRFNYEINEIIDKTYRSSEEVRQDYYQIHGEWPKEKRTLSEYCLQIKDDKYSRQTYSDVYQKVDVGRKYLIVYSGSKKRNNVLSQNWIVNVYDYDKLQEI